LRPAVAAFASRACARLVPRGTSVGPAMIFIVDDDPSIRKSLTRLLRSAGREARSFASAAEFLHDLDAAGADVGCVILDVHMPGMSGPELQEVVNRREPPVPVIVLTATDDADLRAMAVAAGVTKVLGKPCSSRVLLGAVAEAIGQARPPSPPFIAPPAKTATASGESGSRRTGMDDPDNFTREDRCGLYRPTGSVSFDGAVALVRAAIAAARRNGLPDLLVDTTALTGFASPDTFGRFLAAVEWATEAKSGVRLAMVARQEMIHPQKFGVLVAANRGLMSNIFPTEAEARAWLAEPSGSPPPPLPF
jgi:CheY-like chemotaxis protein